MKTTTLELPSDRKITLKLPGPIKLGRLQRLMEDMDVGEGITEEQTIKVYAYIAEQAVEPTFEDWEHLDDWLGEDWRDGPPLIEGFWSWIGEVADQLGPLQKAATSA